MMNAVDILMYGQQTVRQAIDGIAADEWDLEGACGVWSIKDIIAHLASYECLLDDILNSLLAGGVTPYLDQWRSDPVAFNDMQVEARAGHTVHAVLDEFEEAHERTLRLIKRILEERRRQTGTLPWYGDAYSLDDVIVYMYYGHKREHSAQIAAFRDRLRAAPPAMVSSVAIG
jgi:hypothetical protein